MSNNKPRKYDLTGRQFGRLTVTEYAGKSRWNCQCECGNKYECLTSRLISGRVKSCGCRGSYDKKPPDILKPYVFECLARYGNTVISEKTLKRWGESDILNELKRHGFQCTIRQTIHKDAKSRYAVTEALETHIIIEVIR